MAAQQQQHPAAASVLKSFPFRAAVLALCVALLPLLPAQAPEGLAAAGTGQAFVAKAWELVHLLVVGIAVSYGLFSRKNTTGDGSSAPEKEDAKPADARYVSRMFRDSLAPFDNDDDEVSLPGSPGPGGGREDEAVRSWTALHRPDEPVVVVTNGGRASETLSLPVRMLKPQPAQDSAARCGREEIVLPSPIPWRSRSGRSGATRPASPSPSRSPKRLSPASSSSRETLAKATEEYYSNRRNTHKSSSSTTSFPPPPPPPPPPFLVHGYHPAAERRTTAAAKNFKEELQDHSVRGQRGDGDHFSPSTSNFNISAYNTTSSSPAKPSSFDSGSSSSWISLAQELHGSEEPYGYRAYQSIPRFQYERSVSDPILGEVAVSSDGMESSDDDGHVGGGAYSTRESTPEVDENEVDQKAEEFIARFREQIRRQRIESIKRSAGPRGVKYGK